MKLITTVSSLLLGFGVLSANAGSTYYVAANGTNSPDNGTIGTPFATVQYAADKMIAGDSCIIREGRYPEEISISGKDDLTFEAYAGETVVLDGSTEITNSWTLHSGNIYKTTLSEDVWQLFSDGKMLIPARWPNADPNIDFWEQWESDHWGKGRAERNFGPDNPPWDTNGTMYDNPHNGIDLAASGINLSNAVVVLNVGSFRTGTSIVDWHVPGTNKFTYPPITTGFKDKEHYYFAEGKLELLDAENEWFFDSATKELYIWVPGGGDPTGLEIKGKTTTYCLTATDCDDLTVSGIDFFSGTFNLDGCLRARIEHCELTYPSTTRRMLRIIETPQTTKVNSDFAEVYNCTFAYTDGHGITVGGNDATVENCYFHHIDYSCANLPSVMPALYIGAARVTFRHNTLHSFGASVGLLQGNAGTTEYNNFYNGGYKQHDGAMVQVMVAKQTNADIGWNWVHDWSRLGIRFDGAGGGAGGVGGLVHHSVGWGPNMNSTVFIGNHENNEIISNSGIYSKSRPEIVVESANNSNTNTITRNNFARQIAGTTTDGSAVPGIVDHNWDGYDLGLDIRTQVRDPDNLDFRPLPGADIVDAGTNYPGVTDGFIGDAPDIGAYEYGAANYWIAGHQAEAASIPIPPVGTTDAKGSASLMWHPALGTLSNDVFLGTSSNAVAHATQASPEFQGNVANNIYNPLGLLAQTYYWRIDGITPSGTVTGKVWSFSASGVTVAAPGVVNTAAQNVSTNTAVIGGQITDGGTASQVWLHWWATGGATNIVDMGAQDYVFSLPISGLQPGTEYNYRSYAENTYGTAWAGSVETFSTVSAETSPEVVNLDATGVTTNRATIGGQVSLSESTSTWIEWWADGGITNTIDMGTQSGAFSTNLTGLTDDTSYYYNCYGANAFGTNAAPAPYSFSTDTIVDPSAKVAVAHIPVVEDSWVQQGNNEGVNHDGESIIKVRGNTRFGYLKFDTGNLDGAQFDSAGIFIRTTQDIPATSMHSVSNNSWTAPAIVGSNAPVRGAVFDTVTAASGDYWVEFDSSSWITNKGVWSVALSTSHGSALNWHSMETVSNAPYLAVTYSSDTADLNTNNIPDWWETEYFGHIVENTDADLDGVDNYGEYVADTDPTNSNSVFAVSGSVTNGTEFELVFPTSTNRNYAVKSSTNLVSGIWNTETNWVPGIGSSVNLALPVNEQKSFYKVEVSIP